MIKEEKAFYAICDKCGEKFGPYENEGEAKQDLAICGWEYERKDKKIFCYACTEEKPKEDE